MDTLAYRVRGRSSATQPTRSPCDVCLGILQRHDGLVFQDDLIVVCHHYRTVAELKEAAVGGCKFCLVYWNVLTAAEKDLVLQKDGDKLPEFKLEASISNFGDSELSLAAPGLDVGTNSSFVYRINRVQPLTTTYDEKYAEFVLRPSKTFDRRLFRTVTSGRTDSDSSYTQIYEWFTNCRLSHKQCNTNRDGQPWYPTRLLDLTAGGGLVKLVDSRIHNLTGDYMTLSHRWGSAQFLCLSRFNTGELYKQVPLDSLPQAFRDAVAVTRRMGVRYLWIDSLCIIQDVRADWQRESALMEKVYSHSALNISSLAAEDSSQTFFSDRGSQSHRMEQVTMRSDAFKLSGDMISYLSVEKASWDREFNDCPLNHRGWVLQERLLSPRVVHYGQQQIAWECRRISATETFPTSDDIFGSVSPRFKDMLPLRNRANVGGDSAAYSMWNSLLITYSRCALTKVSDKLVAIAGIAKHFADVMDDEYVAGMWRRHLIFYMLWYHTGRDRSHRPIAYRAPSFSWASIDGDIMMISSNLLSALVEIVEVNLEYETADRFHSLKGGELKIRGQLHTFSMRTNRKGMYLDQNPDGSAFLGHLVILDESREAFEPSDASGSLYYMPMAANLQTGKSTYYLLLQIVDAGSGTFRRFGLCFSDDKKENVRFRQADKLAASLPCVSYEAGQHVIRII